MIGKLVRAVSALSRQLMRFSASKVSLTEPMENYSLPGVNWSGHLVSEQQVTTVSQVSLDAKSGPISCENVKRIEPMHPVSLSEPIVSLF